MGAPKGRPKPPGSGRPKGQPNKTTQDVREAIAVFAQANVGKMGQWLDAIPDPAKKMDLYLRALEYHVPKLQRSEITGADGKELDARLTIIGSLAEALGGKRG